MQNDLIANRYKPLFTRGRGGFADVVIAWDTRLARRVAIKRISTGTSLPVTGLEEARTAALLSSPNIVSVYDFENASTETLMVMENVDGPSLGELMADSSELLTIDVATTILDGIVSALEYAHENQVLHLDIKPANILIDQSGHIKVSDFGLAELAGSNGFGEVQGGTIGYMPPEQLTGELIEARTDIWALAALSYQLLTGMNPFFALSPRDSLERITAGHFALPSELRSELSGGIDEALVKALNPQMEARPSSVADFWLELRPHLGKIGPGRRQLKSLVNAWAGKEAALLDNAAKAHAAPDTLDAPDAPDEEVELTEAEILDDDTSLVNAKKKRIAIWNGNYEDDEPAKWEKQDAEKQQQKAYKRTDQKSQRKKRGPKLPIWQRVSTPGQLFIARCICAFAAAIMVWLALSTLPYLSDPLAQAATAAATNTGNPTPALLDAAFTARLIIMIVVAIVAFAAPSIGTALAALCLVLGFFFTGNWLIGMLVFIGCAAWWIGIGRHNYADSAVFALSPFFAVLSLPMLIPLLSGYFQNWKRALGTSALCCFVCSLLSILTYGLAEAFFSSLIGMGEATAIYGGFGKPPLEELLSISPTMMQLPNPNDLFIPLISLITSLEFWIIFASWLIASVVMSLLNSGKSRVKYVVATLCGTGIVAGGYLLPLLLFTETYSVALFAATIVRLVIALTICLMLVLIGVQPKPYEYKGKGKGRAK